MRKSGGTIYWLISYTRHQSFKLQHQMVTFASREGNPDFPATKRKKQASTFLGHDIVYGFLKWEPDDGMKTGNDYRKLGGK